MLHILKLSAVLFVLAIAAGCSIVSGYSNEFSCPASYNGRCSSLQEAYDVAREGKDGPEHDPAIEKKPAKDMVDEDITKNTQGADTKSASLRPEQTAHTTYKESLFKRFTGLINEPVTPMVAPPQVMRVLLLPYKGEANELYMLRHAYFFVDEPKWVLGDSVLALEED